MALTDRFEQLLDSAVTIYHQSAYTYAHGERATDAVPKRMEEETVDYIKDLLGNRLESAGVQDKFEKFADQAEISRQEGANNHAALKEAAGHMIDILYDGQRAGRQKDGAMARAAISEQFGNKNLELNPDATDLFTVRAAGQFAAGKTTLLNMLKDPNAALESPDLQEIQGIFRNPTVQMDFKKAWQHDKTYTDLGHDQGFWLIRPGVHNGTNCAVKEMAEQPGVVSLREEALAIQPGQQESKEKVLAGLQRESETDAVKRMLCVLTPLDVSDERLRSRNAENTGKEIAVDEGRKGGEGFIRDHIELMQAFGGKAILVDGTAEKGQEPPILGVYENGSLTIHNNEKYADYIVSGFKDKEGAIDKVSLQEWMNGNMRDNHLLRGAISEKAGGIGLADRTQASANASQACIG